MRRLRSSEPIRSLVRETRLDPAEFILQEKIDFAPVIETPCGATKAEVRIMYVWIDRPEAVTTIVRMGRSG